MLTQQIVRNIRVARIMSGSALERIMANNKIAEQSLDALKREVIVQHRRQIVFHLLTKFYAISVLFDERRAHSP